MKNMIYSTLLLFGVLVLSRLLPFAENFTPLLAVAVFAPTVVENKIAQWFLPISVLFVTDLFLGFYTIMPIVYLTMVLATYISTYVRSLYLAGILSTLTWHVVVNASVWVTGHGTTSLLQTYIQAIPFDLNLLFGTLCYLALFDIIRRLTTYTEWSKFENT